MRLVHDNRVVGREIAVGLDLRQQDAVGHELDAAGLRGAFGEAHLVAHRAAKFHLQLLRHAAGHRARGDAARLGAADQAGCAAPGGQAHLGQLGGLARAGFARHHDHLVRADQSDDALGLARHRQDRVEDGHRQRGAARLAGGDGNGQRGLEFAAQRGIPGPFAQARLQAAQAPLVAAERLRQRST